MRWINHRWFRLFIVALLATSAFAKAEAQTDDYGDEREIRPGLYSGYVGGNITGFSKDYSSLASYYVNAVLNYESYKYKNGLYFEYANGEPIGTGNNQKVFVLDRTEFGARKKVVPFWDVWYYQNQDEGYNSRLATGPGIGFISVNSKRIKSRENLVLYVNQDQLTPTLDTMRTRGLVEAQQTFKFIFKRWLSMDGNLTYLMATDNLTDYNVNFDAELSAILSRSWTLQFRWDEKYRHLLPRRASSLTSTSTELMILYTF